MYDDVGDDIGYFVLAIQKSSLSHFVGKDNYISPFLQLSSQDLYGVISNQERDEKDFIFDQQYKEEKRGVIK
jgi:hypothetical protein